MGIMLAALQIKSDAVLAAVLEGAGKDHPASGARARRGLAFLGVQHVIEKITPGPGIGQLDTADHPAGLQELISVVLRDPRVSDLHRRTSAKGGHPQGLRPVAVDFGDGCCRYG